MVDGRWFAAHVERGFCGAAYDLVERCEEVGVLVWEARAGGYGVEREAAGGGGPCGEIVDVSPQSGRNDG